MKKIFSEPTPAQKSFFRGTLIFYLGFVLFLVVFSYSGDLTDRAVFYLIGDWSGLPASGFIVSWIFGHYKTKLRWIVPIFCVFISYLSHFIVLQNFRFAFLDAWYGVFVGPALGLLCGLISGKISEKLSSS